MGRKASRADSVLIGRVRLVPLRAQAWLLRVGLCRSIMTVRLRGGKGCERQEADMAIYRQLRGARSFRIGLGFRPELGYCGDA